MASVTNGSMAAAMVRLLTGPIDPDDPSSFDRGIVDHVVPAVEAFGKLYFRAEVRDLDLVPQGPAVVVGNHNAGITFLEPFFMGAAYYKYRPNDVPLYFLAHDSMVDLPLLRNVLCHLGAVRAAYDSADRIFKAGGKLVVYPGGNREAFRRYRDRHRIDMAGRTGFLKIALRAGVPVVPHVQIGGHETFFVLHPGEPVARALKLDKLMRSETCALFLGLPWGVFAGPMFHLPLPSKSVIRFGETIDLQAMGHTADDAERPEVLEELYGLVSGRMQGMMDALAAERRFPILG